MKAKTFEDVLKEVRGKPIVVANRGIPARRICRSITEMFDAVAVMTATDADKTSPGTTGAHELLLLGEDPRSYLNLDLIIKLARDRGAVAIHPGWGFAAEDDTFPAKCLEAGITFIGPTREAMHTLGVGTTRDMNSVITGVFLASWGCPAYTVGEKLAIWRGKAFCQQMLWDTMLATDVTQQVTALDLPVYFFHGAYDYTVSYSQAQAYAARLQAPVKGFYTFEQSAHSPIYEEPERARQIIREDVLQGKNGLADGE